MFQIYVDDMHYMTVGSIWELFEKLHEIFSEYKGVSVLIKTA